MFCNSNASGEIYENGGEADGAMSRKPQSMTSCSFRAACMF